MEDTIDTKRKMIDLFKKVMGDKDFEFIDYSPRTAVNKCYVFSHTSNFYMKVENEYENDYDYEKINPKELSELREICDFDFKSGKTLYDVISEVTISFKELPDLFIHKRTGPTKKAPKKKIIIKGNKWYTFDREIYHTEYHLEVKGNVYIKFGILQQEITEEEFDELYTIAENEFNKRQLEDVYNKLNKRIEKYEDK